MKAWIALLAALLLTACDHGGSVDGVKNAKQETPVRFVICSLGEKNCFVSARFKDMDSCSTHKQWAEMLCDSLSQPNKMICTKDTKSRVAEAYCTF